MFQYDSAPLKVLFLGGSGTISTSAVRLALASGMDVYTLNRGNNAKKRDLPKGVTSLTCDVTDQASLVAALADLHFDTVVNFLSFGAEDASRMVKTFTGRTEQYIHISSASIYGKPVKNWPIVESMQRHNRFSTYAREKIEAEHVLAEAFSSGFPVTVVRPSHTYDDANPPLPGGWTMLDRLARGDDVLVQGDGTSLWTLTHAEDFAQGLVGLFGNSRSIGEAFHVTGNDVATWDQIYGMLGAALGVEPKLVHVPSELMLVGAPDWFWSEMIAGDLAHSAVFDNSKIRSYVPAFNPKLTFERTARRMVEWRAAHPETTGPDPATDAVIERLVGGYHAAREHFASLAP
ncbi:NAD-dependent epimerase/dehydratase family protein [Georgenia deserti]|uniref:NAD-dependent epimerase/dehydratase family protein n=1 Tax=Georgenia deserti TaxID=2093781 RepID=A0ABW4KZQ1_9MICO